MPRFKASKTVLYTVFCTERCTLELTSYLLKRMTENLKNKTDYTTTKTCFTIGWKRKVMLRFAFQHSIGDKHL